MKTFLPAILLTVLLPFPADAGWLFGQNNRTVVNYYGDAPPATVYYSDPVMIYEVPATIGTVVRGRYKTKTHIHHGRTHHRTHTREVIQ